MNKEMSSLNIRGPLRGTLSVCVNGGSVWMILKETDTGENHLLGVVGDEVELDLVNTREYEECQLCHGSGIIYTQLPESVVPTDVGRCPQCKGKGFHAR